MRALPATLPPDHPPQESRRKKAARSCGGDVAVVRLARFHRPDQHLLLAADASGRALAVRAWPVLSPLKLGRIIERHVAPGSAISFIGGMPPRNLKAAQVAGLECVAAGHRSDAAASSAAYEFANDYRWKVRQWLRRFRAIHTDHLGAYLAWHEARRQMNGQADAEAAWLTRVEACVLGAGQHSTTDGAGD
ncbi:hypothetical protein BH23GEM10_BH23GEM10_03120 [soil metagenome]